MKEVLRLPADWSFLPRRLLWQFGVAFCVLVFGGLTVSEWVAPTDAQGTGTAVVVRVIDGDTIVVQVEGTSQTVRLNGRRHSRDETPDAGPVEYYGPEAAAVTQAALAGATVSLTVDRTVDREDAYGRLLRYVVVGGVDFNAALVSGGYARAIRGFQYARRAEFIALEDAARSRGVGLWAVRGPG